MKSHDASNASDGADARLLSGEEIAKASGGHERPLPDKPVFRNGVGVKPFSGKNAESPDANAPRGKP